MKPQNSEQGYNLLELCREKDTKQLSKEYNVSQRTIQRWIAHAKFLVGHDNSFVPEGTTFKGTTTLYDSEGNVKLRWVKNDADVDNAEEYLEQVVEALKADIPKYKAATPKPHTKSDLLACYIVTDFHLGMLAEKEETGEDWNIEIAENTLLKFMEASISAAPEAHTAVLCQLGDFLHYDSMEALTPANKHVLDASSRPETMIRSAIKILRQAIDMLLVKHEKVHIIMADANHDPYSSRWLKILFETFFEDEPRVTVDNTRTTYYAYKWGDTSLFFHHGHKRNLTNVSNVFAGMYRDIFGRTKFSYGHIGHFHHTAAKEDQLMIVEIHPTLAAKDAYAANGGWISQRKGRTIIYSKKFGEVARISITPEMLK